MEKDFLVEGGPQSTISIIGLDGGTVASVTARKRAVPGVQIGNIATSATRVYYLDGDADVRYLKPDGTKGTATRIKLGPHQTAAIAVTPDDRRIAVSILDFTRYPVGTRLYVENLDGSEHVELFSSTSVIEWPAGWRNDTLVVAVGLDVPPQNLFEGFARGRGYHIVDSHTGARIRSICDGGDSYSPEVAAGTVCVRYPRLTLTSWELGDVNSCTPSGPLSPDGRYVAGRLCDGSGTVVLRDATGAKKVMARRERPDGWTDKSHLFLSGDFAPYNRLILNVQDGSTSAIAAGGFFAGALPGGL